MKAYVVVGCGFGDEGKGHLTNYLARLHDATTTIRFNGGGQAGHTVTDGDFRHVFSHVGAGFTNKANTFLTQDFIVNPLLLTLELRELVQKGFRPTITADPDCKVTTIYDMTLNAAIEHLRAKNRHGSCGAGINETVTRHTAGYPISVDDAFQLSHEQLTIKCAQIRAEWVPKRLRQLMDESGIDLPFDSIDPTHYAILFDPQNDARVARDIKMLPGLLECSAFPQENRTVICEGAQGLMLDEQLGCFPHVTRSLTGLANVAMHAASLGVTEIQPVYVMRAYMTRHGAGSLRFEGEKFCNNAIVDTTNVFNKFQQHLRYAPLDLKSIDDFITRDLQRVSQYEILKPELAITCLDQVAPAVTVNTVQDERVTIKVGDLSEFVSAELGHPVAYESWGPCFSDIKNLAQIHVCTIYR